MKISNKKDSATFQIAKMAERMWRYDIGVKRQTNFVAALTKSLRAFGPQAEGWVFESQSK